MFIKRKKKSTKLPKTPKAKSLNKLIKEFDEVFSRYVRLKGTNEQGIARCFTCGKFDEPKNLQCGHYWSRRHKTVRWTEENTAIQCVACNCGEEGNKPSFTNALIRKYGIEILQTLEWKKNSDFSKEKFFLEYRIKEYKQKVNQFPDHLKWWENKQYKV